MDGLGKTPCYYFFGMACKTSNDVLAWIGILFGTFIEELQLCCALYLTTGDNCAKRLTVPRLY